MNWSSYGDTAHEFFVIQELLSNPVLARVYIDVLINRTTIAGVCDRQELSKSTGYKHVNTLNELGIAEELDTDNSGSTLWQGRVVSGVWTGERTIEFGPTSIAAYGATSTNDDLDLFIERYGRSALVTAVRATISYLTGEKTRRDIAGDLEIPAAEGIAVTQAIEPIIVILVPYDPSLSDVTIDVDVSSKALEQCPYQSLDQ